MALFYKKVQHGNPSYPAATLQWIMNSEQCMENNCLLLCLRLGVEADGFSVLRGVGSRCRGS
jgi:hypothetical protein